jgi:hypothetical protein
MKQQSRRQFLANTAKAAAVSGFITPIFNGDMPGKNMFVHHVYFWLKNPSSKEDLAKLKKGLESLAKIKYLKMYHIGKPAATNRDVIDTSYNISWLLIFNSAEDEEKYQKDPIHLKFVEDCKDLWSKVLVYDSVDA